MALINLFGADLSTTSFLDPTLVDTDTTPASAPIMEDSMMTPQADTPMTLMCGVRMEVPTLDPMGSSGDDVEAACPAPIDRRTAAEKRAGLVGELSCLSPAQFVVALQQAAQQGAAMSQTMGACM